MPRVALAAPDAGVPEEIGGLQAEIDRDYAEASTGDCATACRALDSMRNAADKLCALDPGSRCANARQRLEAASARVRSACPTCPEPLHEAPAMSASAASAPAEEERRPQTQVMVESSQPAAAAPRRGGCAGCATAPTAPGGAAVLGLGWLGALAWARRSRRQREPRSIATYRD
jgi:MYXO-CTERM domain-containing protein